MVTCTSIGLRRLALTLVGAVVPLCLDGCLGSLTLVEETRQVNVAHSAGMPLAVTTANGAVHVTAASPGQEVSVKAALRAETAERLAATKVVAERKADGTLSIGIDWPADGRRGSEGCSFDISIPDAKGVTINTSNGPVSVNGLTGDAVLRSSNASITAGHQAGNVDAHTSNAGIIVSGPGGDITAVTRNGHIEIVDAPGAVSADTSNGKVDVRMTDAAPGPVRIVTSNGSVRIEVGAGFKGQLTAKTSNGRVRVSPSTAVRNPAHGETASVVTLGEGGQESTAKTSNAGIDITVRGK